MKNAAVVSIVSVCMLTSSAIAQDAKSPPVEPIVIEGIGEVEAMRITASIEAVDLENRVVTLKGPRGNTFALPVSDRVKNLPQVEAGDTLEIDYFQSLAVAVKKAEGAPASSETEDVVTAKPGDKPAEVVLRKVTAVTDVSSVDPEQQTVTVRGPLGNPVKVKVEDPAMIEDVKAGDQVEVTYVEGAVIAVRPGAAK